MHPDDLAAMKANCSAGEGPGVCDDALLCAIMP
jgi:hypothetical protein